MASRTANEAAAVAAEPTIDNGTKTTIGYRTNGV
jgi:hypothetical protein